MPRNYLMISGFVLLLAVLVSSCASNSAYYDPEDKDLQWALFISPSDAEDAAGWYDLTLMWMGDADDYTAPNAVYVEIGGETCELEDWGGNWFGGLELQAGESSELTLSVDGIVLAYAELSIVNDARVRFPQSFDPRSSATLRWNLAADNQLQIAVLSAQNSGQDSSDEYIKAIPPSERDWTFPQRAVKNLGAGTLYTLELIQMNRVISNHVLIESLQSTERVYGEE